MIAANENEVVQYEGYTNGQARIYINSIAYNEPKIGYRIIKRSFDFFAALLGLIVLLLPMIVIAFLIRIDSRGNPIYRQTRLGKNEKPFTIYKFRSMRLDAEKDGPKWAEDDDPRVTKIGKILRKTRLDELPQLVNILLGQMSFVGPRPERPELYAVFDTYIVGFRQRMSVVPGLTGYAQVNGGYDLLPEEKIVYDLEYIKNRSCRMDLLCILKTVKIVLTHDGAR